jgi:CDP-diacylglycerol--inositol 3-phosphatidyltransferase
MITDRCSTLGLLFILYGEYGHGQQHHSTSFYKLTFLFLALLDISSHWSQQYSTAMLQIHHKSSEGNANRFFLVKWYYNNYPFFGYCCVSAELTYVLLYVLLHLNSMGGPIFRWSLETLFKLVLPGCIMKQVVNIFQLTSSCKAVASEDALVKNRAKD